MNTILNQSNLLEQKFHALIMRQNFITKKNKNCLGKRFSSRQDRTENKTKIPCQDDLNFSEILSKHMLKND